MQKSLYDVLGISKNCTEKEIKAAYFRESKKYHPDVNPDNSEAAEKFREITAAYEVLKNRQLRREYDRGDPAPIRRQRHDPEVVRPFRETPEGENDSFWLRNVD